MDKTRIESIDVRSYALPLDRPYQAAWDPEPRRHLRATVVRVRAGDQEGVGSGDRMLGLRGHESLFIGEDLFDIERHVLTLERLQFHYGRMWPLEIALWDLMGKIEGTPLWRLLGGDEPHVRVYASTGRRMAHDTTPDAVAKLRQAGFPAVKLRLSSDTLAPDIDVLKAVRRRVGDEFPILVDANQGWRVPHDPSPPWDFEQALHVALELREIGIYWLEEPLHRHDYAGLAELRRRSGVRIAGGEGNREFAEHEQYLRHGSLDVYQADVAWSTGILRGTQLAADVRAAGAIYSPHTWGDGLVLLANLHVAAASANAPFVEFPYDPPAWTPAQRDFILPQPIMPDGDGFVRLPTTPGLGIDIDADALSSCSVT